MPDYLPEVGGIWTLIAVSISYQDDHKASGTSWLEYMHTLIIGNSLLEQIKFTMAKSLPTHFRVKSYLMDFYSKVFPMHLLILLYQNPFQCTFYRKIVSNVFYRKISLMPFIAKLFTQHFIVTSCSIHFRIKFLPRVFFIVKSFSINFHNKIFSIL